MPSPWMNDGEQTVDGESDQEGTSCKKMKAPKYNDKLDFRTIDTHGYHKDSLHQRRNLGVVSSAQSESAQLDKWCDEHAIIMNPDNTQPAPDYGTENDVKKAINDPRIIKNLQKVHIEKLNAVQQKCLQVIRDGYFIIVEAPTGIGKKVKRILQKQKKFVFYVAIILAILIFLPMSPKNSNSRIFLVATLKIFAVIQFRVLLGKSLQFICGYLDTLIDFMIEKLDAMKVMLMNEISIQFIASLLSMPPDAKKLVKKASQYMKPVHIEKLNAGQRKCLQVIRDGYGIIVEAITGIGKKVQRISPKQNKFVFCVAITFAILFFLRMSPKNSNSRIFLVATLKIFAVIQFRVLLAKSLLFICGYLDTLIDFMIEKLGAMKVMLMNEIPRQFIGSPLSMPPDAKKLVKKASQYMKPVEKLNCETERNTTNDGETIHFNYMWATHLSDVEFEWVFSLFKENMMEMYQKSQWGYDENSKRNELRATTSRFIIASNSKGENIGYATYRFVVDHNIPVTYCWELQIIAAYQNKGVGGMMLDTLEKLSAKTSMDKVMATVFLYNGPSLGFFHKHGYVSDVTCPSDDSGLDYAILSKETPCR